MSIYGSPIKCDERAKQELITGATQLLVDVLGKIQRLLLL